LAKLESHGTLHRDFHDFQCVQPLSYCSLLYSYIFILWVQTRLCWIESQGTLNTISLFT